MKAIVCVGHTVQVDKKVFQAGQQLNLETDEFERLHKLGFVEQDGLQVQHSTGPRVVTGNAAAAKEPA